MKFLISALPRSGTTWMANWLSTNGVQVLHEPLHSYTPLEILAMDVGVVCTGLWLTREQIACPHVIIERPLREIDESLARIGLPSVPRWMAQKFAGLKGTRFRFDTLWIENGAREVWASIRGDTFDAVRYNELCTYNVQPEFRRWKPDTQIMRDFIKDAQRE